MKKTICLIFLGFQLNLKAQTAAIYSDRLSGTVIENSDQFGLPDHDYKLTPTKILVLSKECYVAYGKILGGGEYTDTICEHMLEISNDFTSTEMKEYWLSQEVEVEYYMQEEMECPTLNSHKAKSKNQKKKGGIFWFAVLLLFPYLILRFKKYKHSLAKV